MSQIVTSKNADLVRTSKLPFTQKLALTEASNLTGSHLVLSETLDHPVIEVIKLFNLAIEEHVLNIYPLADGLAVEYYGAPIQTVDADFLVFFPETDSGLLDPSAFFEFFKSKGAHTAGEYLVLHGLKFQMIPANNDLAAESLRDAVSVTEKDTSFFVITIEHLIALKLKAWRYKDRLHINHLLQSGAAFDQIKLCSILEKHRLVERWEELLKERNR